MYTFELKDTTVKVTDRTDRQRPKDFDVSYPDWFAFCDHLKDEMGISVGEKGATYTLPPGCLSIGFPGNGEISLDIIVPEQKRGIAHAVNPSKIYTVPFPRTKMEIVLVEKLTTSGKHHLAKSIKLFAALDDLGKEKRHLPFPNVYDENTVCWGSNPYNLPIVGKDFTKVMGYYEVFTSSLFNNDLWRAVGDYDTPTRWFAYLETQDQFPYALLNSAAR